MVPPETELTLMVFTSPAASTSVEPDTMSTVARRTVPVTATSPETLFAVIEPVRPRTCTSPETELTVRSPIRVSTMMSPDTVLSLASLRSPETSAPALTTPRFRAIARGTATLTSARGPPEPKLRNTSRKLSQPSCGWSISTSPSCASTRRSLVVTPCTSMRMPGSSWAMMSTCPPTRPTLRRVTDSMSMTRSSPGAMSHFSVMSASPGLRVTIYRVLQQ